MHHIHFFRQGFCLDDGRRGSGLGCPRGFYYLLYRIFAAFNRFGEVKSNLTIPHRIIGQQIMTTGNDLQQNQEPSLEDFP